MTQILQKCLWHDIELQLERVIRKLQPGLLSYLVNLSSYPHFIYFSEESINLKVKSSISNTLSSLKNIVFPTYHFWLGKLPDYVLSFSRSGSLHIYKVSTYITAHLLSSQLLVLFLMYLKTNACHLLSTLTTLIHTHHLLCKNVLTGILTPFTSNAISFVHTSMILLNHRLDHFCLLAANTIAYSCGRNVQFIHTTVILLSKQSWIILSKIYLRIMVE